MLSQYSRIIRENDEASESGYFRFSTLNPYKDGCFCVGEDVSCPILNAYLVNVFVNELEYGTLVRNLLTEKQ